MTRAPMPGVMLGVMFLFDGLGFRRRCFRSRGGLRLLRECRRDRKTGAAHAADVLQLALVVGSLAPHFDRLMLLWIRANAFRCGHDVPELANYRLGHDDLYWKAGELEYGTAQRVKARPEGSPARRGCLQSTAGILAVGIVRDAYQNALCRIRILPIPDLDSLTVSARQPAK